MYESIISACQVMDTLGLPRAVADFDSDRFIFANQAFLRVAGIKESLVPEGICFELLLFFLSFPKGICFSSGLIDDWSISKIRDHKCFSIIRFPAICSSTYNAGAPGSRTGVPGKQSLLGWEANLGCRS